MSEDLTKYIEEATNIGDDLLEKAIIDQNGYHWKTLAMVGSDDREAQFHVSESLYSGVAGIVFFFQELHRYTQKEKYKKAYVEGLRWLENHCAENPTSNYAFYTGRLGVAYLMILASDYLEDESYKSKALQISTGCEVFLESNAQIDDLINGVAGCVMALLHIHAATGDEKTLKQLEKFVRKLVDRASVSDNGLYWDRSGKNIRGLCGFSHGAAGVGYAFLELGRYFNDELYYWIAEKAFAYENHYFDDEMGNWPDFRKGFYSQDTFQEYRERYLKGDKDFFLTSGNMAAWCHGSPGIGLSRIRAAELLNAEEYSNDLDKAIKNTFDVSSAHIPPRSFTLCHGSGGNAILFLEALRIKNNPEYIKWARMEADYIVEHAADQYASGYAFTGEEDTSLFMGNAGIGYFLLLAAQNELSSPSILKPDVNKKSDGALSYEKDDVLEALMRKMYPKTLENLKGDYGDMPNLEELTNVKEGLTKWISRQVEAKEDNRLAAIFAYEKKKVELDTSIQSHSYNNISRIVEIEKNKELFEDTELLLQTSLVLSEDFEIVDNPFAATEEDDDEIILAPLAEGVIEFPINDFATAVIQKFIEGETVKNALEKMIEDFGVDTEDEINQVKEVSLIQVKEAMAQGMLKVSRAVSVN